MQPTYIFETSWEVCNRVGGIYAVHFAATGEEIAAAAQNYLAQLPEEMAQLIQSLTSGDSGVDITFYLQEQKLVKLSGKLYRAEASLEFDALLGPEPEENPVSLEISTLSDWLSRKSNGWRRRGYTYVGIV